MSKISLKTVMEVISYLTVYSFEIRKTKNRMILIGEKGKISLTKSRVAIKIHNVDNKWEIYKFYSHGFNVIEGMIGIIDNVQPDSVSFV